MTDVSTAAPDTQVPKEPTGSRLDSWWEKQMVSTAKLRLWHWGAPAVVLLIAAVLRLWNLGNPHSLVFDETFYVKDGWTLWNNGYESTWGENADQAFNNGDVNGFTTDPSYVVHPPLGKWLIGAGMALFGADNSFGWRFGVAIAGILLVALVMFIAKRLMHSTLLAVIAGGLLAIDGHAIVLSRVSLLDNFVALFTLLGFMFILLDREGHARRLQAVLASKPSSWGPAMWARPYLFLAGVSFGLSMGVKWSGLYFLAAFGVYVIVMDALDRRNAGIQFWLTAAILKQGPVAFVLMVPVAIVTYFASWTGWILTSGGYDRNLVTESTDNAWTGFFSWVPYWFQSLWGYHQSAYSFHVGLTTPHSYQSNPLTWLLLIRPTSMYYAGGSAGEGTCTFDSCASAITALANPLIWWSSVIALAYLIYRFIRTRQWQIGLILMGMVAGYLPWLMFLNRTVFHFYGIVYEPYLILGLAFTLGIILGKPTDPRWRRLSGLRVVTIFGIACIALSIFFYPLWSAMEIPYWYWHAHMWLQSWI